MAAKITGCGYYLPKNVMTNQHLTKLIDTSEEWIETRTGILQRHIADNQEYTSHLALKAAQLAIKDAKIEKNQIDLIILCTTTPDNSFPSTATKLQGYLKLNDTPSFDLQGVCCGFIYGLEVANNFISTGKYNTVLLVAAEKISNLVDWHDRSTCILFGDGAGAVILQNTCNNNDSKIIDTVIYSDGMFYDILHTDGGPGTNKQCGVIKMQGKIVFKQAIEKMSDSVNYLLKKNNISIKEITHFIPHQANNRIIEALAKELKLEQSQVVNTVARHANCSAASIPLAIGELKFNHHLKEGDLIITCAIGAGLTWGASLIKW